MTVAELQYAIEQQRERLIDYEIAVNDARQAIDCGVEHFHAAVRERDRVTLHLAHLEELWLVALGHETAEAQLPRVIGSPALQEPQESNT